MMSKLDQIVEGILIPVAAQELMHWLVKIECDGDDTLSLILTCVCAGYSMKAVDLLNGLHNRLGASGIIHQIEILDEMDFDQQMAYQRELKLSTAAYFMLLNLSHCIGEFRQIRDYLKGIVL